MTTTFDDPYTQGMWDTAMQAVRLFGDAAESLEKREAGLLTQRDEARGLARDLVRQVLQHGEAPWVPLALISATKKWDEEEA